LKTSRTGGFVGCGNYPECTYTRPIAGEGAEGDEKVLGEDAGDEIWLKSGRFGPYVQRGEATPENKKPPRASLPKGWNKDEMDLEKALTLLNLPRQIGEHPDGGTIVSNFGRFGPYLMHQLEDEAKPVYANLKDPWGKINATLPKEQKPEETTLELALELISAKAAKGGKKKKTTRKKKA